MTPNRFEVLDSWRGIAACAVALFHLKVQSAHLYQLPLLRNAFLFVDFFFVLSGFVIAATYRGRLLEGFGVARFMLLRWGRLYPLHVAMLAAFLAFEALQIMVPALAGTAEPPPFAAPNESADTIIANALLIHGLGLFEFLTWNWPSWSISTEFWTYLIFALALLALRQRIWMALAVAVVVCPIWIAMLSETNMHTTFSLGFVRCLYGFAAGVITHQLFMQWPQAIGRIGGTRTELATIIAVAAFVCVADNSTVSVLAPYFFAAVVLIFAAERGAVSRFLRRPAFLVLGALSYSIYMVHAFVAARLGTVAEAFGTNLAKVNPWLGDALFPSYLLAVVCISYLTYRYIEQPGREWSRRLAGLTDSAPSPYGAQLGHRRA